MEEIYRFVGLVLGLFSLVTGIVYVIGRLGLRYIINDLLNFRETLSSAVKRIDILENHINTTQRSIQEIYVQLEYIVGSLKEVSEKISLYGEAEYAKYKQAVVRSKKKGN